MGNPMKKQLEEDDMNPTRRKLTLPVVIMALAFLTFGVPGQVHASLPQTVASRSTPATLAAAGR